MRRHPVHDRVGDQQPAEIVGRELERLASGVGEPGGCQGDVEQLTDGLGGDRTVFCAQAALEQQRHRRVPLALVVVVGNHQGNGVLFAADPGDDGAEHVGQLGAYAY